MNSESRPGVHLFYCVNAFEEGVFSPCAAGNADNVQSTKIPCSAMIKDVYILKAFECGADGVMVVGCPSGKCKRIDGNIRAAKRVAWVQKLLDEIGLGGNRLVYADGDNADSAFTKLLETLDALERSPLKAEMAPSSE